MTPRFRTPILALSVLILAAFALPALAGGDRPRFDPPPQNLGDPTMLRPVDVAPGTPIPTGMVRRDPADPRDGTRPFAVPGEESRSPGERRLIAKAAKYAAQIGGDDFTFIDIAPFHMDSSQMAFAQNGDLFFGYTADDPDTTFAEHVVILRSTDGGTTWSFWGQLGDASGGNFARLNRMIVAEGAQDRLYVQYMTLTGFDQNVAFSDLALPTASWTIRVVYDQPGVSFITGDLTSDADAFGTYYLYSAASGLDGNGDDIWYARSTDFGVTWSAPYRIASISSDGDLMYFRPRIEYGYGGVVHVAWTYTGRLSATIDDGVRYRRATGYGASVTDWDPTLWALKSETDGSNQALLGLAASLTDGTVVVAHSEAGLFSNLDPRVMTTTSSGSSWAGYLWSDLPFDLDTDLEYRPSDGAFVAIGEEIVGDMVNLVRSEAAHATPTVWTVPERFNDAEVPAMVYQTLALDPSRSYQTAVTWANNLYGGTPYRHLDAEWRGGPGYPNFDTGFPVDLAYRPISPPAIVNLDGDPYGEIVFGDANGNVQAFSHLGLPVPGWPHNIGAMPPGSPVAVGALDLSDEPYVVAATTDGVVFAFDGQGNLRDGFPVILGTNAPTYVTIGALGGPHPRVIVACSGDQVFFIDHAGELEGITRSFSGPIVHPAAVGDVDADGVAEVVTLMGPAEGSGWSYVHVFEKDTPGTEMFRSFTDRTWSDAPTLFDLDLDGDLEIAAPTEEGFLYVMHHDGSDVTGFPFDNGTGRAVTSAAAANNLGGGEPELAFASEDSRAHLVWYDGAEQSGYPASTTPGWWVYAAPILDKVDYAWASVVLGSRGYQVWSYDNFGSLAEGWPKTLDEHCELSPAAADIDLDGNNEIVFLTRNRLVMVDVNHPGDLTGTRKWPMYGFDPQRTGCLDCEEDVVTAAPEGTPTRVSFAPPSPNPASGPALFRYLIPAHAAVSLDVFDVRGHRVRRVHRAEEGPGEHVVTFDGKDRRGHDLAAGLYYARLTVRGPGVDEVRTRKLTLIR